ncbi:MAG: NAD-dependent epimerase/dehydratase family protein [Clostridiales bacterium]|nr:NAD-dependent epimerase/dehydratase family protein [Clostridiales bacterium]
MINILITGTSGALGNNLRQFFLENGYNVIGTVGRSAPRENEIKINLGEWNSYSNLLEAVRDKKIHAIIHNAAMLKGKGNLRQMYAANVKGTENVLRIAKEVDCSNFIQISTVGIYGIRSLGKKRDESTKPLDIEAYGITKRKAEVRVRKSGLNYTILRLPLIKYSGDNYIESNIKQNKSVFIKKRELNIVSSVTPEFVAKTCKWLVDNGPLNNSFNCASHHQTWRDMVTDHCKHENIEITNKKRVSIFGAIPLGIVIGPIAAFGQHTPSDKLEAIMND